MSFPLKLALYALITISVIGGIFFTGYKAGSNKQKVIIQEKIIRSGERHAEIEQRQAEHLSSRGQRYHIKWLREGNF